MYKHILILLLFVQLVYCIQLDPISKLNVINNGTGFMQFTSLEQYINISINNIEFSLIQQNNLYYSIIQLNEYGSFDIYLNNQYANLTYTNQEYINNYNTSITLYSNIITPTTALTANNISYWIVLTTIVLCGFALLIIFIAIYFNKSSTYSFLYYIDKLYINTKKDIPSCDLDDDPHEIKLGIGIEVYDRSSVFGGISTVIVTIISIFVFVSYFYDTLASNTLVSTGYSINNNNFIPVEKSTLYTKLTFKNLFYGECSGCNNWNIWQMNIQMNSPICTKVNDNCIIETKCEECVIDVGNDAYLYFQQINPYIAYQNLEYNISTSSYDGIAFVSGIITTDKIFTGPKESNNTIISLSIIPTVYTEDNSKEIGFILDSQNILPGSIMNTTTYNNLYNFTNKIAVTLKINRNPNWLHITSSEKSTKLEQFSELYGILGGLWATAVLLLNIITAKPIRRILYLPWLFYKRYIEDKNVINIKDKMKEIEKKYIK
jgi:hypothetical protein